MPESTPPTPARERFDVLLTDPRHYRGDLRAVRAALREGRLDSLTQAERDALVARVRDVLHALTPDLENFHGPTLRAFLSLGRLLLDFDREDQREHRRALGLVKPGRSRRLRPRPTPQGAGPIRLE